MKKIAHVREAALLTNTLPQEVVRAVTQIAAVLDNEYGADRNADADLGGYVLLLESREELEQLQDIHIDVETAVPEYVDKIEVQGGEPYTHTLLLLGSDFTVSLVMPLAHTPERFVRSFAGEGWEA